MAARFLRSSFGRGLAALALCVGPSQAAATPKSTADAGRAQLFTSHAHRVLANDVRAHTLRLLALNQVLERRLLDDAEKAVTDEAIGAYYHKHQAHFQKPEAIALWRLLTSTEEQAKFLLTKVQQSGDPVRTWSKLVREHSLDKATSFRRGSLGYVWPDGDTDVPQVRVSPLLFAAAKPLRDGELLPHPVREGTGWALIWRRDMRKKMQKPLEEVRTQIRQQLALSQARSKLLELIGQLRATHLRDFEPEHVDGYIPPAEPPPEAKRPLGEPRPAAKSPVPRPTDLGDR